MSPTTGHEIPLRPYLGLTAGILAVSTASTLIRLAQTEAHSLVIAAWRLVLASLILAPLGLTSRRRELRTLRAGDWRWVLASGLLLALHFASWITSLAFTSVAASVVLVTSAPLFVGLASHLLLKERLSRPIAVGLVVATAGGMLIGAGDLGADERRLLGDGLALVGAMAGAAYFLIGRRLRPRLSLLAYVFPVYTTAAVALLGLALAWPLPLTGYSPSIYLWFLLLALGPQLVGHSSLNWALKYLSATFVTLTVLTEPIGSTMLAYLVLGERPGVWTLVGGSLVLAGIAVASQGEARGAR